MSIYPPNLRMRSVLAVSLGGDSDTLACITGGIAQAFYSGVSEEIEREVYARLDDRLGEITKRFMERYCDHFK